MHALLAEGMRSGEVEPLPWTVYARGKMQDAFRYLASGAAPHSTWLLHLHSLRMHCCASCHARDACMSCHMSVPCEQLLSWPSTVRVPHR